VEIAANRKRRRRKKMVALTMKMSTSQQNGTENGEFKTPRQELLQSSIVFRAQKVLGEIYRKRKGKKGKEKGENIYREWRDNGWGIAN